MTQHTSGPWHIGMNPGPMIYGPHGEQVSDMRTSDHVLEREEARANLRLIAAAPDLLDVVKSQRLMLYAWKGAQIKNGWPWDHIQAAINETEAAIAKATGDTD